MRRPVAATLLLLIVVCLPPGARAQPGEHPAPIVVQGAMPSETDALVARLDGAREEKVGAWTFWIGTIDGYPVIVSRTLKGMENAAAATVLAIERYHPAAIVNQGTAGGYDPDLKVYDIVVGTVALNIGAFRAPYRKAGEGSAPMEWTAIDMNASPGSVSTDPNARRPARFEADPMLVAAAHAVAEKYAKGRVVDGAIGSANVWNDEIDRIALFRSKWGIAAEEMETASAAQVASFFRVPFVGIRILSDNITNGGAYDPKAGEPCQQFVYEVVKRYAAGLRAR